MQNRILSSLNLISISPDPSYLFMFLFQNYYNSLGEVVNKQNSKENENTEKDQEMTQDSLESNTAIKDEVACMNEESTNPDLEWETTARAEAKKLTEIRSDIPYENPLLGHLYTDCKIVDRVVQAWDENEGEEPRRKGYMGHLTRIANIMVRIRLLLIINA